LSAQKSTVFWGLGEILEITPVEREKGKGGKERKRVDNGGGKKGDDRNKAHFRGVGEKLLKVREKGKRGSWGQKNAGQKKKNKRKTYLGKRGARSIQLGVRKPHNTESRTKEAKEGADKKIKRQCAKKEASFLTKR